MNEFKIYGREIVITEDMEKILIVFKKWGIDRSFCDSDIFEITEEILMGLKQE